MKQEKSCGAVIYKYINNELYILLLKHNKGHWSFAKGHMEENETEKETAIREVKEETNLDIDINTNFREISKYSPKKNVIKDVIFFLATPKTTDITPQLSEIKEIKWYKYEQALDILTYDKDKKILILAHNFIIKNCSNSKN